MNRPTQLVVVAGTATEVGKTWVAARAIEALRARGCTVAARKPAQSFDATAFGDGEPEASTDAALLGAASGEAPELVCPPHRWYRVAMAPPMAADSLGRSRIHVAELVGEVTASWARGPAEVGLVELAGGPWSPVAHDGDGLELSRLLRPDLVVLVADAGLGTLNAVRPAAEAFATMAPVTVVLNRFDRSDELHRRNLDWLREHDGIVALSAVDQLVDQLLAD
ncbi:MAG: dethiobiotin synthase [Actinomycetota bacterium]|nr:dethiobiotin synthase [Actinomycetota bacterium]